jgi:hypothetical protein
MEKVTSLILLHNHVIVNAMDYYKCSHIQSNICHVSHSVSNQTPNPKLEAKFNMEVRFGSKKSKNSIK